MQQRQPASVAPEALEGPELRIFRPDSPYAALGLAVNYLMTKPACARLRLGEWSRILVGQINRRHFCFAVDSRNRVQGFMGWAFTTRDKAEAWVEGRGGFSSQEGMDGECVVFNAWAAESLKVTRFLLDEVRKVIAGKDSVLQALLRRRQRASVAPGRERVRRPAHRAQAWRRWVIVPTE